MKKSLLVLCFFFLFIQTSFSQYYYGNSQQIPLQIDSTRLTIKFENTLGGFDQDGILISIDRIIHAK